MRRSRNSGPRGRGTWAGKPGKKDNIEKTLHYEIKTTMKKVQANSERGAGVGREGKYSKGLFSMGGSTGGGKKKTEKKSAIRDVYF